MFQQLNAFCDDEEGEDQVKAKALQDRTLYIEPSRTHTNEIKIDGKFKGTGRSARQKEDDKKVIVRFRRWLREQEPPEKQEGDEQGAQKPGNDERQAKKVLESSEEKLELSSEEKEALEKLQQDERWQLVTRGAKINKLESSPFILPTCNKFSLLSDLPSPISSTTGGAERFTNLNLRQKIREHPQLQRRTIGVISARRATSPIRNQRVHLADTVFWPPPLPPFP